MIYSEDFDPTIGRSIRKLIISFYQINSLQESLGVFHEMNNKQEFFNCDTSVGF